MAADTSSALMALHNVFANFYEIAMYNLDLLSKTRGLFSNPYRRVRRYDITSLTDAMDAGSGVLILAHREGTKVDFTMHERLLWLSNGISICNNMTDSIDKTMSSSELAQWLKVETQSVAIRAALLRRFAEFSRACVEDAKHDKLSLPEFNPDMAEVYYNHFGDDLKKLAPSLVDRKVADDLIKSLSMPTAPVILTYKKDAETKTINGVYVTDELYKGWMDYVARMQATAMANRHNG